MRAYGQAYAVSLGSHYYPHTRTVTHLNTPPQQVQLRKSRLSVHAGSRLQYLSQPHGGTTHTDYQGAVQGADEEQNERKATSPGLSFLSPSSF